MAKYVEKFHIHRTPVEDGSQTFLLIAAEFILIYLLGVLLFADLSDFSLNTFFHPTGKTLGSYLFLWLTHQNLFIFSFLICALPSLSNKTVYSLTSAGGFLIAYIAGIILGNMLVSGYYNPGWYIWGIIYFISIITGIILQLRYDRKHK